jgi:hypothetical protein
VKSVAEEIATMTCSGRISAACGSFWGMRTSAGWYHFAKPVHKLNLHLTPDNTDVSSLMATVDPFVSSRRVWNIALQIESEILPSFRPFEYCR